MAVAIIREREREGVREVIYREAHHPAVSELHVCVCVCIANGFFGLCVGSRITHTDRG